MGKMTLPNKGSFTQDGGGAKEPSGTKIQHSGAGDLRSRPCQNKGTMKGSFNS